MVVDEAATLPRSRLQPVGADLDDLPEPSAAGWPASQLHRAGDPNPRIGCSAFWFDTEARRELT
jgi:hypothetical protein